MATLAALSNRLRAEIGDMGRTFVESFEGDGETKRFQLTNAPVLGSSLTVKVGNTVVSNSTVVEEVFGMIELATAPADGDEVTITGTFFKYFTRSEIEEYINTAFIEHASNTFDSNGAKATLTTLPQIDEYPLVLLASTMALFTLATDAAFDIDIISPDGVSIPRSERYRQLTEIIQQRKEQYRELCTLLGVGLHKIDVFNLRRVSRRTNYLVPVYKPQEIDDKSMPQRVWLPIPGYGDITPPSTVPTRDLSVYAGDDFEVILKFNMDLSTYTPLSQIRLFPSYPANQVGPVIVATFDIVKFASVNGGIVDSLKLSLQDAVTASLPATAYWDIQLTSSLGEVKTYLTGKVFTRPQVSKTMGDFSV